jgi:galactokinase/mevalonate kinase-like predicted kinase
LIKEKISGYIPKYIDDTGKEVEMKKDGVVLQTYFGMTFLSFSTDADEIKCIYLGERMKASSIEDLRAAIYQTIESIGEMKKVHNEMIQVILNKEKELMDDFLNRNWAFKTVADLQK